MRQLVRVATLAGVVASFGCASTAVHYKGETLIGVGKAAEPPAAPPAPPAPEPARVEVTKDRVEIHEKIQFDVARATIKAESASLLDEIGDVIKKHPDIKKIQVEGFTSAEGRKAANLKLSDDRAKSVTAWLTGHGVTASRLTPKGYGDTQPVGDNKTPEGRAKNRRVELKKA